MTAPALLRRLTTFRHLRTRLTVLYMGLFGLTLLLTAIAVVSAVSGSARRMVRDELGASGEVYAQIWASRSAQLKQGAAVLAQDYGFREAVATGDQATVRSALDNLRARQGVEGALILGVDGYADATGVTPDDAALDALYTGLDSGRIDAGVIRIGDQTYQAVAAPIMAPVLIGWVVFTDPLDAGQMRNLERLSAIPLSAQVLARGEPGWIDTADRQPALADTPQGRSMVLARPLPSFNAAAPAALVLTYPLTRAMKPYQTLFLWLGIIAVVGLAIIMAGTWRLSRDLTRPITALDEAVHRVQQGEYMEAPVGSSDEIGRLAARFNAMIGDLRDREHRLTHMALHDQETGLPNRLALERLAGSQDGLWVVLIGIDRFEVVRNAIGYDAMARLITAVGMRLTELSDGGSISRVSAAVLGLVVVAADEAEALRIGERLCGAAHAPFTVAGAPVDIALTAGVACRGGTGANLTSPVDRAAAALAQARRLRRVAAGFDATAYGDPAGNLSLISELMAALDNGEFSLAYQPKYDFRAERITGVEALARWTHPRRGFVPPDLFVAMAEETGHIRPLTEWVVRQAIKDQATMAAAGHEVLVSVNISGRLLSDDSFADFALEQIAASGAHLCFEITETAVMDDPERALAVIERLSAAGVYVSLDDYGSGLSSLTYLKRIKADELKIDKSFVMGLDESARDALLVKSTIDLAHSLGLRITAEGVETPTALALLRGMGCDMAQGYLIGRPKPLAALIERLNGPAVEAEVAAA